MQAMSIPAQLAPLRGYHTIVQNTRANGYPEPYFGAMKSFSRSPSHPAAAPVRGGAAWARTPLSNAPPARFRRWLLRRRRLVAALLLCAAAALAVQHLTPAPPASVPVVVAARDVAAGATLRANDLAGARVSPGMVPDGAAADPARWVGRQLSGPLRRGEVITDAGLMGSGLLVGAPPGSQAVPLRLSDPSTVQLLRQGQLVNVVLSSTAAGVDGPPSNEVLAQAVPILWTPALSGMAGGLLPSQETEGMVVVAASADQALKLAGASARGKVFLVLVG